MFNKTIEYQPVPQVWSQDLNKQYDQTINKIKINGQTYNIGAPHPYSVQTISVNMNDVILIHVAEDLDIETVNQIYDELKKSFPDNNVLIANEYILKGLTIIKPPTGQVVVREDITENDLQKWLHQNVEFNI